MLVPAFVLAVVFVPAAAIAIAVMVPAMLVLEAPVLAGPVATVVAAPFIAWNDPDRSRIRRARPVALVPAITTLHRVPVAFDPHVLIFRTRAWRAIGYHPRFGRHADLDSDGNLAECCGSAGKKCACK